MDVEFSASYFIKGKRVYELCFKHAVLRVVARQHIEMEVEEGNSRKDCIDCSMCKPCDDGYHKDCTHDGNCLCGYHDHYEEDKDVQDKPPS